MSEIAIAYQEVGIVYFECLSNETFGVVDRVPGIRLLLLDGPRPDQYCSVWPARVIYNGVRK